MVFFKRAAVVVLLIWMSAFGLRALDWQYGELFEIRGIERPQGHPVMPLTRGKYANVRVLGKETFDLLHTCQQKLCKQAAQAGAAEIASWRAARTRPGMWIADVAVDGQWLLTFLIFQTNQKIRFVVPDCIQVLDQDWLSGVEALLQARLTQTEP